MSLQDELRELSRRAYCEYIAQCQREESRGFERKLKDGEFGKAELDAHMRAGELLGRHRAFAEATNLLAQPPAPLTEEPWLYAIEETNEDGKKSWHDGEQCVFGDRQSAQDEVDSLNDAVEDWQGTPYAVVPLYRAALSASTTGAGTHEKWNGKLRCGKPAGHLIAGASWFSCVLPPNHEGECKRGGTCFKHGDYVGDKCPQWPNCLPQPAPPSEPAPTIVHLENLPVTEQALELLGQRLAEREPAAKEGK